MDPQTANDYQSVLNVLKGRNPNTTAGLGQFLDFSQQGLDDIVPMLTDEVSSKVPPIDPNKPITAYRGENLIRSLGSELVRPDEAGQFYGFTSKKAQGYPFDKAPGILGGAVTRTMEVMPSEIIEANRKALYSHAKTMFETNINNGVEKAVAENIYFKDLNQVDNYITSIKTQLDKGLISEDRFKFLLQNQIDEGMFPGRQGDIDIKETYKRGNVGVAALTGAARALPKAAFGLAGLPIDAVLGATETGLDAQEEVGQAMGIDPDVFYQMDPEQFENIYNSYKMTIAKMQQAQDDNALADSQKQMLGASMAP